MKWKLVTATVALFNVLFGTTEIPIDAENKQLNLSEEQKQKVIDALGQANAEKAFNGINAEIKAMADGNLILKAAQDELEALVLESGLTAEELAAGKEGDGNETVLGVVKTIAAKNKEMASTIAKLMNDSEGDVPGAVITGAKNTRAMHTASHLFGSGKSYDAFDGGRAWNARMRDGSVTATDFNQSGVIPTLQSDLTHFVEENNGLLSSLFNDFAELPSQWDRRSGVLDRVSDGHIIADEIVQGRAKGWAPKNKFKIAAEQGQVWRKKIDITFNGYELQEIENTWIRTYNKNDGSHPWKMSFIGFLLGELIKAQKIDDRRAQINGLYVESPENVPGAAVNSQNGLRYLWFYYRDIAKKYRAFDLGAPTQANIVDYINDMIKMIPEDDRNEPGMEIQLSSAWMQAYRERATDGLVRNFNTDQANSEYQLTSPVNYPNFIFQELKDQTMTDFIAITKSKNIQILDYDASEKGKFTIVHNRRDTDIFADYRLGIRIKFVGTKLESGDPRAFEVQKVWSNNVPVFGAETFIPAFDIDNSGILKVTYPNIAIDAAWKTDVTSIEGVTKGSIVRIKGNTGLVATKNLKKNTNLLLGTDFSLASGGTITLFVQADGKFKELSRTAAPEVATTTDINYAAAVIDSKGGNIFRFNGVAPLGITSIINGVEGKAITIYGGAGGAVTIAADVPGITVASAVSLAGAVNYINLIRVNGAWVETSRA